MIRLWFMILLVGLFSACSGDDEDVNTCRTVINRACCSTPLAIFEIGAGKAYVPNIITANGDGVNDIFLPFGDSTIVSFENLELFDRGNNLIVSMDAVLPNDVSTAWNGFLNGEVYNGSFSYKMIVNTTDGQAVEISGNSCVFNCGEDAPQIQNLEDCRLPDQFDPQTGIFFPVSQEICF